MPADVVGDVHGLVGAGVWAPAAREGASSRQEPVKGRVQRPVRNGDRDAVVADIPCRELVELVTDYLEDRLPPQARARFEVHLAECEYCETYLEQMRQTIRVLGRLPEESLSAEARDALLGAFRDWSRR